MARRTIRYGVSDRVLSTRASSIACIVTTGTTRLVTIAISAAKRAAPKATRRARSNGHTRRYQPRVVSGSTCPRGGPAIGVTPRGS